MARKRDNETPWREFQEQWIREVMAAAARQRLLGKDVAARAGIASSYYSEIKNIKVPATLPTLLAITTAVGLKLEVRLVPSAKPSAGK